MTTLYITCETCGTRVHVRRARHDGTPPDLRWWCPDCWEAR